MNSCNQSRTEMEKVSCLECWRSFVHVLKADDWFPRLYLLSFAICVLFLFNVQTETNYKLAALYSLSLKSNLNLRQIALFLPTPRVCYMYICQPSSFLLQNTFILKNLADGNDFISGSGWKYFLYQNESTSQRWYRHAEDTITWHPNQYNHYNLTSYQPVLFPRSCMRCSSLTGSPTTGWALPVY